MMDPIVDNDCPICKIHSEWKEFINQKENRTLFRLENKSEKFPVEKKLSESKNVYWTDFHQDDAILAYDEDWILRKAPASKNCPGYLYLEPRSHVCTWNELGEYLKSLGDWIHRTMEWIQKNHNPRKIYTVTISEKVPHIHFHLVPHYEGREKGIAYLEKALGEGFPT